MGTALARTERCAVAQPQCCKVPVPAGGAPQVIISSSFETSVGLSHLAQLAAAVDVGWAALQGPAPAGEAGGPPRRAPAHGLGTGHWLARHLTPLPLITRQNLRRPQGSQPADQLAGTHVSPAADQLAGAHASPGAAPGAYISISDAEAIARAVAADGFADAARAAGLLRGPVVAPLPELHCWQHGRIEVTTADGRYSFGWRRTPAPATAAASAAGGEAEGTAAGAVVVLLHGFLGDPEDWRAVAQALAAGGRQCLAVGLPGCADSTAAPLPGAFLQQHPPNVDPTPVGDTSKADLSGLRAVRSARLFSPRPLVYLLCPDAARPFGRTEASTCVTAMCQGMSGGEFILFLWGAHSALQHRADCREEHFQPESDAQTQKQAHHREPKCASASQRRPGRAGQPEGSLRHLTLEAVADAVAEAIAAATGAATGAGASHGAQRAVHLVGYSLGARLALAVAVRHPLLASRLVLISGSPGLEGASPTLAPASTPTSAGSRLGAWILSAQCFLTGMFRRNVAGNRDVSSHHSRGTVPHSNCCQDGE